jgi:nitrogen fixation/metabolism regulation signal transduction histidine kinase
VVVNILGNPMLLKAVLVFFVAAAAFVFFIMLIRGLRKNITAEADLGPERPPSLEALPLHLYNTVIQQLKQQKHELQVQNQVEQRRARTTENFSQAVLSNLTSGVLVFDGSGLVKQANRAAKEILGFQSPAGMSAEDIFRGAEVSAAKSISSSKVSSEVSAVLRDGGKARQVEADYLSPTGKKLRIAVTVSPVPAVDGTLLGAACMISDRSELERIRNQQQLQGEVSAEMALELRTSLATITGYAKRLERDQDAETLRQIGADITSEAARLDRRIGGLLAAKHAVVGS